MAENKTLEAIQSLCAEGAHPTLKAIAMALEVPQQRIYSVAKQPKAGEVYDANVYNWDAIDRFVTRRLDADKGLATHEDVIRKAQELDVELKQKDGRRGSRGKAHADIILEGGKSMPGRKFELTEGQKVMMRGEVAPTVYEVKMFTDTHVVLQAENSPLLSCYSNWTVNQKFIVDETRFDALIAERKEALESSKAPEKASGEATIVG